MNAALYWIVWISLGLFALGELGKRHARSWAWPASAIGLALLTIHIVIAMSVRHHWSHDAAIAATAGQTQAVYGLNWGGGLYVNYVYVAVWSIYLAVWHSVPSRALPSRTLMRVFRVFFLIVIVNAAIIFAGGWRRLVGVFIVGALLVAWRRRS